MTTNREPRTSTASETLDRALLEAVPDLMTRISRDGTILEFKSAEWVETPASPSEIVGKNASDVLPPEAAAKVMHYVGRALETGEVQRYHAQLPVAGEMRQREVRTVVTGAEEVVLLVRDITERKRVEEALHNAQDELKLRVDEYRTELRQAVDALSHEAAERREADEAVRLQSEILQNISEAVYLVRASDGFIVYANPSFEQLFGYGHDEMVGKHVSIVNAPTDKGPEEKAKEIMAALDSTGVWRGEILNVKKDGTTFWCRANVSAFDHPEHGRVWATYHTDITERKRAEEVLRESEARFRQLAETTPAAVLIIQGSTLAYANAALEAMVGYTREELATMNLLDFIHPDHRELVVAGALGLRPDPRDPLRSELKILTKDGEERWLDFAGCVAEWDGRPALLATALDITKRKRAEALLGGQTHVLEMLATGASLEEVLRALVLMVEEHSHGMLCSVLLVSADKSVLRPGVAPNLPDSFNQAVAQGIPIGPNTGSCGTAAYHAERVISTDIANDPKWTDYRELALSHGLRACWSTPIFSSTGEVLGTFAMYYHEPRDPDPEELHLIGVATAHRSGRDRTQAGGRGASGRRGALSLPILQDPRRAAFDKHRRPLGRCERPMAGGVRL